MRVVDHVDVGKAFIGCGTDFDRLADEGFADAANEAASVGEAAISGKGDCVLFHIATAFIPLQGWRRLESAETSGCWGVGSPFADHYFNRSKIGSIRRPVEFP